jgi:hypothetical protein
MGKNLEKVGSKKNVWNFMKPWMRKKTKKAQIQNSQIGLLLFTLKEFISGINYQTSHKLSDSHYY